LKRQDYYENIFRYENFRRNAKIAENLVGAVFACIPLLFSGAAAIRFSLPAVYNRDCKPLPQARIEREFQL